MAKMSLFILFFLWVRTSLPRLRIDQLMSYAWKVLIPFSLVQIFLNGLVLVYDLPNIALFVTSGAGALAMMAVVYKSVRVTPRRPLTMVSNRPVARSVV
jgi:NADH-quinone oxidoreductase subunit H